MASFIRAVYYHDEGVHPQTKTWRLPDKLPAIMAPEIAKVFRTMIADEKGIREAVELDEDAIFSDGDDEWKACPVWDHKKVYTKSGDRLLFDAMMSEVCHSAPVKDAVGRIFTVFVPTFN